MSSLQLSHTPNQWSEAKSNEEMRPWFLRRKTVTFSKVNDKERQRSQEKGCLQCNVYINTTAFLPLPGAHAFAPLSKKKGLMETL